MTAKLPKEFADLERFADWCLPTEAERYTKRLASSMDEMQVLYDAVSARAKEAIEHCNRFPLDAMPDDVLNLLYLIYSLVMVSFPIECWRQPRIPDSGAASIDCLVWPVP
jgi:hypothetical protein